MSPYPGVLIAVCSFDFPMTPKVSSGKNSFTYPVHQNVVHEIVKIQMIDLFSQMYLKRCYKVILQNYYLVSGSNLFLQSNNIGKLLLLLLEVKNIL